MVQEVEFMVAFGIVENGHHFLKWEGSIRRETDMGREYMQDGRCNY